MTPSDFMIFYEILVLERPFLRNHPLGRVISYREGDFLGNRPFGGRFLERAIFYPNSPWKISRKFALQDITNLEQVSENYHKS